MSGVAPSGSSEDLGRLCAAAGVSASAIESHLSYWVTRFPLAGREEVRARAQRAALSDRLDDAAEAAVELAEELAALSATVEAGELVGVGEVGSLGDVAHQLLDR